MLTVEGPDGRTLAGSFDPEQVSVATDPSGQALIVSAPREAISVIDRFVGLLDQSPVIDRLEVRRYALEHADAGTLARTLQTTVDAKRQGRGAGAVPRVRLVADDRTNTLLVTATAEQHAEIAGLIEGSDVSLELSDLEMAIIPLEHALPSAVRRIVEQIIVGRDPARRDEVQISAEDQTNMFVVKGDAETIAEVRALVAEIDVSESGSYPVRSIRLERADAAEVAQGLQRFFQQRARLSGRRGASRSGDAAIFGDRGSGTVVIAASDEDYEQIRSLVDQFDAPVDARSLTFKIVPLQNATVSEIEETITDIGWELSRERMYSRNPDLSMDQRIIIETNRAANAVILFGEGEIVETIEGLIAQLDVPRSGMAKKVIKAVHMERGDLFALARLIEDVTASPDWQWWRGPDPEQVQAEVDRERRLILLVGDQPRVEEAAGYIRQIAEADAADGQVIESIRLKYAEATQAASSLSRFFRDKARAEQQRTDRVAVIGSREGNLLIVTAPPEEMPVLRDLVAQIDQPEMGADRRIEVYTLANSDSREVAGTLRTMFPGRGPIEDRVLVTPQPTKGALIVSAPDDEFGQIEALIAELDAVDEDAAQSIVTVPLESARAADVAISLRAALPRGVNVTITPVERSNALLLTGSDEAVALVVGAGQGAGHRDGAVARRVPALRADTRGGVRHGADPARDAADSATRAGGVPSPSIDYSLTRTSSA
jgi:type II secretory pathway component GspD/PulD (secretin)